MGERSRFNVSSTTDEVLAGLDLDGMAVAVTGASGGLGLETARCLAARGARVLMAGRGGAKLDAAVAAIRDQHPDADLVPIHLDLADLASCRRAAGDVLRHTDRLHLLINNAGVMCTPHGTTVDGFETQFGTNHLGHMAWTLPLVDTMLASSSDSAPSRVINLSSAGHRFADVDLDDPNFEHHPYDPWVAYGASKTANILFSIELERRHGAQGLRSLAVHPGGIHTDLGRHFTPELRAEMAEKIAVSNPTGLEWKSIPQGAATTVWAAITPDFIESGAVYCEDCGVAAVDDAGDAGGVLARAIDPARARRLWEISAALFTRGAP